MPDLGGERIGLVKRQFEMLGRDAVDQSWRFAPIRDDDNSAVCLPARASDVGAWQAFQMTFDRRGNRASKTSSSVIRIACAAVSCSACDNRSAAIHFGSLLRIGDDQNFRRPGDHVDADPAKNPPFCRRDIGVAGTDDLVDRRDRRRTVSERRHCLRPADAIDLIDPEQSGGRENQRVQNPAGRRHRHYQPPYIRDLGGNCVHQDRRGISRGTAGYIETDSVNRPPALCEPHPQSIDVVDFRR